MPSLEELGSVSVSEDELPTEDDDGVSITEELDGSSPPSSPEQEKVSVMARAKVAASANFEMMFLIVLSPFLDSEWGYRKLTRINGMYGIILEIL
jgi:hypothetical protein